METNQDQIRELANKRCMKQTVASKEIEITHIHFNYFLRNKKDLGAPNFYTVIKWLIEHNKNEAKEIEKFLEDAKEIKRFLNVELFLEE